MGGGRPVPTLQTMARRAWVGLVAAVGLVGFGCAPNVKVLQREGCWVKQTESFPKTISEEVGFCARKAPVWSNDRVTRLVQECMAEADYRWQTEALNAWSRGAPLPKQSSEDAVMKACMDRASTTVVLENEGLRRRVAELTEEQKTLMKMAEEDRAHFRAAQEQMTQALGEAAKKPAPSAFATANSNGTATNESEQTAERGMPNNTNITIPTPPAPVVPVLEPEVKKPEASCAPDPKRPRRKGAPVICATPESAGKLGAPDVK